MAIEWSMHRARLETLLQDLARPNLEVSERARLQKEASRLQELLTCHDEIESLQSTIESLSAEMAAMDDEALKLLYQEEQASLQKQLEEKQQALDGLLYPPDERDNRSAFLEIRAGAGGAEAALFAADLLKMYTNYALKKGWQVSIVDMSETDLGGIREVIIHIQGKNIFGHLKREAGVHRVQRVPKTETSGRIHTSTATVAVLPEADEVDVSINPADLRIDTYRAGGAGGQHVNKTDSAVRITHLPTGIVVACQDERSQHKNRAKAMKMLQAKLYAAERERQESALSKERKEMVGTGMRAEKVRTYNYPQNRITDHQINLTLNKLDIIMEGHPDEIIDALMKDEREKRRATL